MPIVPAAVPWHDLKLGHTGAISAPAHNQFVQIRSKANPRRHQATNCFLLLLVSDLFCFSARASDMIAQLFAEFAPSCQSMFEVCTCLADCGLVLSGQLRERLSGMLAPLVQTCNRANSGFESSLARVALAGSDRQPPASVGCATLQQKPIAV